MIGAISVFVALPKTAAYPSAAHNIGGNPSRPPRITPRDVPIENSGVTSPPWNPIASVKIVNNNKKNILVSIHQNKFEQSKYSGAQMFYSTNNDKSQILAENIRKSITGLIQPENKRELKKGGSDIYLLNKATVPAVIVECGFISNEEEAKNLSNEEYQSKIAFAIYCGILEYKNKN